MLKERSKKTEGIDSGEATDIEKNERHAENTLPKDETLLDQLIAQKLHEQRSLETLLRLQFSGYQSSLDKRLAFWGTFIVVILALLGFFGYSSVKEFVKLQVGSQLAEKLITPEVDKTVKDALARKTGEFVKEMIDPLRQDIKELRTSIDKLQSIAKTIDSQNSAVKGLSTEIKSMKSDLSNISNKTLTLTKAVDTEEAKYKEVLKRLEVTSEFALVATNAKMGDKKAFDQLRTWLEDNTFPFQNNAVNAWWGIVEDYAQIPPYHHQVPWPKNVNPSKLNIDQLRQYYFRLSELESRSRAAVIQFIWERPDIPKRDKMQFLVDVMNKETNLFPIEIAGRYFSKECDLKTPGGLFYKGLLYVNFIPLWDKCKETLK